MPVSFVFNGPIPGENYTSDTRNYPWHRPPEYTNIDDALDYLAKKLAKKEGGFFIMTMLGFGLTIKDIVSVILFKGVGEGKWAINHAILMAGPLSHMIVILAKKAGIDYDLGIKENYIMPTESFFKEVRSLNKIRDTNPVQQEMPQMNTENVGPPDSMENSEGFMADIEQPEELEEEQYVR